MYTRATPGENSSQRGRSLQEKSEAAQGDNHAKNDLSARGVWIEIDTHDTHGTMHVAHGVHTYCSVAYQYWPSRASPACLSP